MAYRDDITALNPDHLWRFDGGGTDDVGSLTATLTGTSSSGVVVCEDSTNSVVTNSTADYMSVATSTDIDGALDRKAVAGWLRVTAIQQPPKSIYREGTTGNQFNIVMWAGNNVMLDVVNSGTVVQAFSDNVFQPNREYHIFTRVEGSGFGNKVEIYIDGVKQSTTEPANGQLGATSLAARTAAEWGEPTGTTEVGNEAVGLNAIVSGAYAFWATWSGADAAALTDTQIREELFEKGALTGVTITTDTEANMQTDLDTYASTVRPDEPLNIRVEDVTGGGDLELTADDITHDPLASIHVQWMGTGTLTWINGNGSNASIGSTPNGGTINFQEAVDITVTVLDASDSSAIQGARVLLLAAAGGPATEGDTILAGLTDVNGQVTLNTGYIGDQPVTGRVRKGSVSPFYKTGAIAGTVTSAGFNSTVFMVSDE